MLVCGLVSLLPQRRTDWISGVSSGDAMTLHGNSLAVYTDAAVGVLGQLKDSAPIVNTAYLDGLSMSVSVYALLFASSDTVVSSTVSKSVDAFQPSGMVSGSVSESGFSHSFNFSVFRPAAPTLSVDDSLLQALPGTCGGYQRTRLHAVSGGVDISRLLASRRPAARR